ncbi:LytR/AlgR family response regulator transcription factor [Flavitalea flava]
MHLKCLIVDDEPVARKLLQEYVEDTAFLSLTGKAENVVKARAILDKEPIDLIFLDINMPKLNGLDFLRSSENLPLVILTTAYAEYALEGFELDVMDYLVKPFSFERFLQACQKAKEYHELKEQAKRQQEHIQEPIQEQKQEQKEKAGYFFVKCNGRIEKVDYADLQVVEAALNYIILHTGSGKMIVYLTIRSMAEQLPSSQFLKVHKSFIVNLDKVKSIEGNILHVEKMQIPVSQQYHEKVMKEILKDRMLKR